MSATGSKNAQEPATQMIKKIRDLYTRHKEIVNYVIVGGLTTLVSLLAYYLSVFTFLDPQDPVELQAANVISWVSAVVFAYFTNRKYVFESKNKNVLKEGLAFGMSRLTTLLIEMGLMFVTVSVMKLDDKIMKLVAQFVVIVGNYVFSKFIVFRKKAGKGRPEAENQG